MSKQITNAKVAELLSALGSAFLATATIAAADGLEENPGAVALARMSVASAKGADRLLKTQAGRLRRDPSGTYDTIVAEMIETATEVTIMPSLVRS